MPILDVEIVGDAALDGSAELAGAIADAAGEALGARAGGTWVKLRFVPPSHYAESAGGPPAGVRPVFVRLILRAPPEGDALEQIVRSLTSAIAEACDRPAENVHLVFEPPAEGRVAFGGTLVTGRRE